MQPKFVLLFIPVFDVALTAQCHKVVNGICFFTAPHSPGFNVVNIYCPASAHLAGHEVAYIVAKMAQVDFCVLLHDTKV
jgi:hypothetical protein